MLLMGGLIRPAEDAEIPRTADTRKVFFHNGFGKMLARHEFRSQCLINALTGQVGPSTQMSGYPR